MELLGSFIFNALALVVTLGILVTFHEFGHFWVARRCGVKVERFSVGFGKPLLRWQRGETEYVVAAIPLGGYVKMFGEQQGDKQPVLESLGHDDNGNAITEEDAARAFNRQSLARRSAIVAAGPIANFLLAIVLYWLMFVVGVAEVAPVVGKVQADSPAAVSGLQVGDEILQVDGKETQSWQDVRLGMLQRLGESGEMAFSVTSETGAERLLQIPLQRWLVGEKDPDPLAALGITPYRLDIPAQIGELVEGGRAAEAGLQEGDLIDSVNGENITGWIDWVDIVRASPEQELLIDVQRAGRSVQLGITPALTTADNGETYGYIGAGVVEPEVMPELPEEMQRDVRYSLLGAIPRAVGKTAETSGFVLNSLKKMVTGLISVENLAGPVTIAQVAGQSASYGFEYFVGFLAILSISLGVLNLLPIPVLDGGHLFYNLVEFIIRKPVPEKVQQLGMQLGILLILSFTLIAFYNDFNRLL